MKKEIEFFISKKAHTENKKTIFSITGIQLIILAIINFSIIEIITSSLTIQYFIGTWLIFVISFYYILYFVSKMKKQKIISWLILIISLIIYSYYLYPSSSHGYKLFYNHVALLINSLYHTNLKLYTVVANNNAITSMVSLFSIFLSVIFYYFHAFTNKTWLINLTTTIIVIIFLFLGVSPSSLSIIIFIISSLFLLLYCNTKPNNDNNHNHKDQKGILIAISIILFFTSFSATLIDTQIKIDSNALSDLKYQIQQFYINRDLFYPDKEQILVGGVSNGTLHRNGKIRFLNIDHLKVTTSSLPTSNIYIKSFIGDTYTEEYWGEISEKEKKKLTTDWDLLNDKNDFNQEFIKIDRLITTNNKNVFFPYVAAIANNSDKPTAITNIPLRQHDFSYFPVFYGWATNDREAIYNLLDDKAPLKLTNGQKNKNRTNFSNYLSFSSSDLEKELRDAFYDATITDYEQIIKHIQKSLDIGFRYTLDPGRVPENKDYISHFLFDRKTGYCVHYATAATLLFRLYGIPSRYVEGYVVSPRNFVPKEIISSEKTKTEYTANVKDRRAHAWTEIYLDGFGWIPIETTPMYIVNDNEENTDNELEIDNNSNDRPEKENNNQENNQQNNNENEENNEIIDDVLTINSFILYSSIFSLLVLLIIIKRIIIVKIKKRKCQNNDYNQAALYLFIQLDKLHQIINRNNQPLKLNLPSVKSFSDIYPFISENKYKKFREIILKINYSKHQITIDELQIVIDTYNDLSFYAYSNLSIIKKTKFLLLKNLVKKY